MSFVSNRKLEYEALSYGEQKRLQAERSRAQQALRALETEAEVEKPEKEDPIPNYVRVGIATSYKCVCGKEFYATAILPKCAFCGVEGMIKPLGKILVKDTKPKKKEHKYS